MIYRYNGNIDNLENHWHSTKLQFFSKNCDFHIDQIKERLVKRQLKMLGMVQKINYIEPP